MEIDRSKPSFINLELHEDDRGSVHCIMDNLDAFNIKRIYRVDNLCRGQVRGYHGHRGGETYIYCLSGAIKCAGISIDDHANIVIGTLSARRPRLFYIPAGFANGYMALMDNSNLLVLSTLTFNEVKLDDPRLPWDIAGTDIWTVKHR